METEQELEEGQQERKEEEQVLKVVEKEGRAETADQETDAAAKNPKALEQEQQVQAQVGQELVTSREGKPVANQQHGKHHVYVHEPKLPAHAVPETSSRAPLK